MKLAVFAALIAIALPAPVLASDWVEIGVSAADGSRYYVDRQSIRLMPNGYKRAWNKRDFSKADIHGDTGVTGYDDYDCIEKRFRNLSFTFFNGQKPNPSSNKVSEWVYVAPDSIAEALLNFVCYGKL